MVFEDRRNFWREAFAWQGSVTPLVLPTVLAFGLVATIICVLAWLEEYLFEVHIGLEIAPFEIAGAVCVGEVHGHVRSLSMLVC